MARKLVAILAADVVGYSRLMAADEAGTLDALKRHREAVISPALEQYSGRLVKLMGDGVLAEFASAVDAVECALEIQNVTNADEAGPIILRIGINLGEVLIDGDDIYGDSVNIACRLEALAEAGGICVSEKVHLEAANKAGTQFSDMGLQQVKNIAAPIRAFSVAVDGARKAQSGFDALFKKPAVAVLPFKNLSGDPEQDYFGEGISEDVITLLSAWRSFPIVARNSSFAYQGKSVDIREMAKALSARYVIEGSVRRSGNRVRVSAQLVDAETGTHLLAEKFDGSLDDIFEFQDDVTRRIVAAVEPRMERAERNRAETKRVSNMSAWDHYMRARALLNEIKPEENAKARELYQQAIAIDPDYSDAFAGLSHTYQRDILFETAPDRAEWEQLGLEAAKRAVALDAGSSLAHLALGGAYIWLNEHDQSVAATRTAVELNPSNVQACLALGNRLDIVGEAEEGIELLERSLLYNTRDPHCHVYYVLLARAYINARDYERAHKNLRDALRRQPEYPHTYHVLAICLGHLGRNDEAKAAAEKCEQIQPGFFAKRIHWNIYLDSAANDHLTDGLRKAGLA